MLNIFDFPDNEAYSGLLTDEKWRYAIVHDLNTKSTYWSRASFVKLSKKYTANASSALIYLLQKEAKALSLWEREWGNNTPAISNFMNCLSVWGRFTNTAGESIPVEEFWKSYDATIQGLLSEPSFEYQEEGITKPYTQHLVKEHIEQVICFDNTWNEQNFFIETRSEWILFNWGTMA